MAPALRMQMSPALGDSDRCSDSDSGPDTTAPCSERLPNNVSSDSPDPSDPPNATYASNYDPGESGSPEELVGISINPGLTSYVISPITPAEEKARYIQASDNHFFTYEEVVVPPEDLIQHRPDDTASARTDSANISNESTNRVLLPHRRAGLLDDRHQSQTSRTVLKDGFQLRRRASSGPGAVAENLKRMFPDFSSLLSFRPAPLTPLAHGVKSQSSNDDQKANPLQSGPRQSEPRLTTRLQPSPLRNDVSGVKQTGPPRSDNTGGYRSTQPFGLDGSVSSLISPTSEDKPGHLRRVTSDSSLYLRKSFSGAASFDDTSKWEHASEQVNSRIKAITDTFQDSNFRLPKLPSINFAALRPGPGERSNSGEGRESTMPIFTRSQPDPLFEKPSVVSKGRAANASGTPDQRSHPIISDALSKMTGDVVIMGGYRGSILRSAKPPHRQLWIPVKVGLNMRKVDLEVGLNDEDEENMEQTVIPSGSLSHIGPIDICRRLLRNLRKCPNARSGDLKVHDYGYDWRLSPDLLSRKLIVYLEKLECNHPETPKRHRGAIVIAHSLGGLITRHAVNLRPDLFAGVVYAGVPQSCVNILGPLRNGDDVLLSSRVLTAQVNFTLRTSYALLPEDGGCFIDKFTGERYDIDFFDVKTWEEYCLTPCLKPALAPGQRDHRKSLVGAFSDSISSTISSSIPSSNKRSSWFGSRDTSPSRGADTVRDAVANAAEGVTYNSEQSDIRPEGDVKQSLEPTMASASSSQSQRISIFGHPSVKTACTLNKADATEYLSRTLARVLAFKRDLPFRPEIEDANAYPPLAIMFGKTVPTVFAARVASREAIKNRDAYDDLAFAAGDGVVLASAAQLPKGYRCVKDGRVETDRGHIGLLGDLEGVGKCLAAVWEARKRGVGLGIDLKRNQRPRG